MIGISNRGLFLRTALVLVLSLFALNAHAQGGFGGGGGGFGGAGGFGGIPRAQQTTWAQFVLDPKELDLTREQRRTLRDLCDQFEEDVKEIVGDRNTQITAEMQARVAERQQVTIKAIEEVLTERQLIIRQSVIDARAAARAQGGPGGFGGGGFGGGGGPR